ncbi:sensor histidine kinase [Niabella sp. CC-SYL272]|uniref:ATP-binding protein n=1 Tax=Niabella agricola TaxID=2891571 RepID=UPI001F34AF1A|nr:sensor histidine kinase [Niabella agricola]MCF3108130.1 sensor histidine kinase [Niabella agricola]
MLVLLYCCSFNFQVHAQQEAEHDMLRGNIARAATDSLKVAALYAYMKTNLNNNTSDFEPYIKQMIFLSKRIKFKWGLSTAYILGLSYYKNQGKFELALKYADSVVIVTKGDTAADMRTNMGHMYNNRGNLYYNIDDYENALKDYFQAERIFRELHHKMMASTYTGIANCFMKLKNHSRAFEYSKKAVAIARDFGDDRALATNMMNLASAYMNTDNYVKADSLLNIVWPIVWKLQNSKSFYLYYYGLGNLESDYKKDTLKALNYYRKSYSYALENEDVWQQGQALDFIIHYELSLKHKGVKADIDKLYKMASRNSLEENRASALNYYAIWYNEQGHYRKAYTYQKQFQMLSDSLYSNEIQEKTAMMEIRFRVANKDQEIHQLRANEKIQQLNIRQKNALNYMLTGGALVLFGISILGYHNYKNRQKFQQAKIDELEAEKQLAATEAVLKGEEQERTRLAKDLHDGLGGMLSGVKYSLSSIKGNMVLTPDNARAFERSIDMLDSSIREMRRVAHNMMPEVLVKYGLNVALQEFCDEIDRSSAVHVSYQSVGIGDAAVEQTVSVTIYRIIQELINNAIKHAYAQNILVQLHISGPEKRLTITVEDDGKGFDKNQLSTARGMGWSNIQNRVDFLKGKIDLHSEPGKGTSVLIEVDI